MSTSPAKLSVLVGKDFACVKIAGRANFTSSPDFKTLLTGLSQKGYGHFIIDLSECVLMDSTFLGVLAGFGLKLNQAARPINAASNCSMPTRASPNCWKISARCICSKSPPARCNCPTTSKPARPNPSIPTHEQITRTSLEAHQTLMAVNPDNVARFKDVTQFLAEDLKTLEDGK